MTIECRLAVALVAFAFLGAAQQQAPPPSSTRPPENNEQGLRPLTPEEIAPNLNFYAMDPLYDPNASLGWSATRIRETLDRGVVAVAAANGAAHVSWRLLDSDPAGVRFNVYRTAGGRETKLTAVPIRATTDLIDTRAPDDPSVAWRVAAVVTAARRSRRQATSGPARRSPATARSRCATM